MIIYVLLLIAMPCFIDVPSTPVFDVISSENENECAVFVQWLREPLSSDCPILFHTISYRRQGKSGWKRLTLQKQIPIARSSRQNVLRNMSSSLWLGTKWDRAPLLLRRTQRKEQH